MSRVFTEDENNDIFLGPDNKLAISEDLQAVLQACQAAVEIQKGEAIYAQENGMPNRDIIWDGTPNLQKFEFFSRKQILNVSGVEEVVEFESAQVGDVIEYQALIKTIYGTGEINGGI
jgi:hypothetical protein